MSSHISNGYHPSTAYLTKCQQNVGNSLKYRTRRNMSLVISPMSLSLVMSLAMSPMSLVMSLVTWVITDKHSHNPKLDEIQENVNVFKTFCQQNVEIAEC